MSRAPGSTMPFSVCTARSWTTPSTGEIRVCRARYSWAWRMSCRRTIILSRTDASRARRSRRNSEATRSFFARIAVMEAVASAISLRRSTMLPSSSTSRSCSSKKASLEPCSLR